MTDYTKIKSKYIKSKIKNLKRNIRNMAYIHDLMTIEQLILRKYIGITSGYVRKHMQEKYPKEWDTIGQELNPWFVTIAQEKMKYTKENRKLEEELRKEEQKEAMESKRTWKKVGGKI